ncbi:DUF262 domain-containing protein [Streptomyces sp. NPDC090032]|uniref:GmrSD restriction endonuclease domain-containing protein n=1 Tax=Streptomyces sp. NPDC090032 TaxID=3365925 RepID=UPI0037F19095
MQAKETLFADLVQGRAQQFQVPLYQRTYSWTEKQLRQLWNDILEQAEIVASEESAHTASTHFLGSVVLAPSPQYEVTFPYHLVVDGQQRLTTLTLALAALRDHVTDTHPEEADRINEEYLVNKRKKGTEYFRLLPTQADRAAFAAHIRGPLTQEGAVGGVATAYAFFRRKLVEADDRAIGQDVFRIEQAITSRLTLVSVTAERGDNVHRIFESLNNTGLQLSQADLLRNHLFMRLPTRGEHVYETYWLPLQDSLANDELEQLMWLQLVLDGDDRVRRQDLYAAQQRRFERQGVTGEAEIEAYIRELHRRGAHLRRLLHPEEEPDPGVCAALHRLDVWQATATHPALMLLLDRRERGDLDDAELARALAYVESFLVRRMICRIPTNNLNRVFQALPGQLPLDVPVAEGLRRVLSAENRFWPDDEELRERIRTAPFYQYGRWNQRALVLQRLEESYGHPEPVDFAAAQLTIEHVLPQSPGKEWLATLAEETQDGESAEELHARLRHTLGNLTLTAQNTELSNHPFTRKQDLLDASHLEMNRRIAATDRWGAREILARADELADRAVELWPAPLGGVGRAERGRDWGLAHQALAALPHGTWTSYGDVAALLGSSAQAVGQHLAQPTGIIHAYRVLTSEGRVAAGFQWPPGYTGPDVRARLAADGVLFTVSGAADPVQRLTPDDLAALVSGEDGDQEIDGSASMETGADRFFRQLAADDSPETVAAVAAVLVRWEELGGWIGHGGGTVTTSAFLMLGEAGAPGRGIWPLTLYPGSGRGGTAEVVFQHLTARAPFTDRALRAELLTRLNQLEGIDIPEGKLELRPSFRLTVLDKEHNQELLNETLEWFRGCWERRDAS